MPLTKSEASDLDSLHKEIVRLSIDLERAAVALSRAQSRLIDFMWKLAHTGPEPAETPEERVKGNDVGSTGYR